MSKRVQCERCGASFARGAVESLCPTCLLEAWIAGHEAETVPDPAVPFSAPAPEEIDALLPDFEVGELIGAGGMGAVYKARQRSLDRTVAIKVLPREQMRSLELAERFLSEAKMLAKLNHPNIVTVHDFGEAGALFYLVMEYIEGASLAELIRGGVLKPVTALALVPQICEALEYAHGQGVVHRDIKPANLLVTDDGRAKIADFGLAKLFNQPSGAGFTESGQMLGTESYMAPEQRTAPLEVDHRADIYSLGVVIYEMLTGELPLGHFVPPSEKAPVGKLIDAVVLRALEADRERRYQQVSELRSRLEHAKNGRAGSSQVKGNWRTVWFVGLAAVVVVGVAVPFWGRIFPAIGDGAVDKTRSAGKSGPPVEPVVTPKHAVFLVRENGRKGCAHLSEALREANPGSTIQITDDSEYGDPIHLSAAQHEGLTLEATGGAKLSGPLLINGVPKVTIRGFEMLAPAGAGRIYSCAVAGHAPGCVFEDLTIRGPGPGQNWVGIDLLGLKLRAGDTAVAIRRSRFEAMTIGVRTSGSQDDRVMPMPCRGVLVADNTFVGNFAGFELDGEVVDVVIGGNKFIGNERGILFQNVLPGTRRILVANNTFHDNGLSFLLYQKEVVGSEVRFFNNLSLSDRESMGWGTIVPVPGAPRDKEPPGDGRAVAEAWEFDYNCREGRELEEIERLGRGQMPPGERSRVIKKIEGIDRDSKRENHLRPEAGSALWKGGAGTAGLPEWIGAVSPEGAPAWTWTLELGEE